MTMGDLSDMACISSTMALLSLSVYDSNFGAERMVVAGDVNVSKGKLSSYGARGIF